MFDITPILAQPFRTFATARNASEYDEEIVQLLKNMKHKREDGYAFTYELKQVILDFAKKHNILPIAKASDLFMPVMRKYFGQ